MTTVFTWKIAQLERQTSDGFVTTAHWTCNAQDGDFSSGSYGTVGYTQTEGETYTPFDQLTEEQVIAWVQTSLGKDVVEASLQNQIDAQKNPVQATGLPWAQGV